MMKSTRVSIIAIVCLSIFTASAQLTRGSDWGDDFASYLMQAISIVNGSPRDFVVHNAFTIEQSSFLIGPVAYPWGYPLFLAPFYKVFGLDLLALKIPNLLFFAGFLLCLYSIGRNRFAWHQNLLWVSLFAFNPMFLNFLDKIASDIPYLFFSTLALVLMLSNEWDATRKLTLGLVLFFAFFVRTSGILLIGTLFVDNAFRAVRYRLDKASVKRLFLDSFQVCGIFMILWFSSGKIFPDEQGSYLAQMSGITLNMVKSNTSYYFRLFSFFIDDGRLAFGIYFVLVTFFTFGLWIRRRNERVFVIYFVLLMLNLLFWTSRQGPRFIFPLYPIFIYFTLQGMLAAIEVLPRQYTSVAVYFFSVFWLMILGVFLFSSTFTSYSNLINNRSQSGPFDPYSMELYGFINEETSPESVMIFFKPRVMRLMTNRDSVMNIECDRIYMGDYIVFINKDSTFAGVKNQLSFQEVEACDFSPNLVFENDKFAVYEILH